MKIHLIGIGGIGVSALAQYYLSKEATRSETHIIMPGSGLFQVVRKESWKLELELE